MSVAWWIERAVECRVSPARNAEGSCEECPTGNRVEVVRPGRRGLKEEFWGPPPPPKRKPVDDVFLFPDNERQSDKESVASVRNMEEVDQVEKKGVVSCRRFFTPVRQIGLFVPNLFRRPPPATLFFSGEAGGFHQSPHGTHVVGGTSTQ